MQLPDSLGSVLTFLVLLAVATFFTIKQRRYALNAWSWIVSTFNRKTDFKYARTTVVEDWPELPEDLANLFHQFMERATIVIGGHITPSDNSLRLLRKERVSLIAIKRLRLALKLIDREFLVEKRFQALLPYRNDMDAALAKSESSAASLAIAMSLQTAGISRDQVTTDMAIAKVYLGIAKWSALAAACSAITALIQMLRQS